MLSSVKGDILNNKLILLFVFDKMEVPLTQDTIEEMCCSANDWLSFMDCKPTLSQLLDAGLIYKLNNTQKPLYAITHNGRVCLADFFTTIPCSIREKISQFVKRNKNKYRKKQEYVADYFMNNDGTYTVYLKIVEAAGVQFELKFVVPSRQMAKDIYSKWPNKAESAYAIIYDNLID